MEFDATLKNKAIDLLNSLDTPEISNLNGNLANRVLSAYWQGKLATVVLASDDLTLDQKLYLERQFTKLAPLNEGEEWHLYFKRQQLSSNSPSATPKPKAVQSKLPFGLEARKKPIEGVKHILAVASGKGGVGKSTVSSQLAFALTLEGKRVGLLDADIYGPSAPTMLGINGPMTVDHAQKLVPIESHGVKCVSFGFLSDAEHPVMWRGPLVSKSLEQFCYDVAWQDLDILIIDLPPGTGDVQLSLIEMLPIAAALIVSTPQDIALLDAHKAITMFKTLKVPILGMIENMASFLCPCCGHFEPIFGETRLRSFAYEQNIPVIASIPLSSSIRLACDLGKPLVYSSDTAQSSLWIDLARHCSQNLHLM